MLANKATEPEFKCPEQEFLTRVPLCVFMDVEGTTTPVIL